MLSNAPLDIGICNLICKHNRISSHNTRPSHHASWIAVFTISNDVLTVDYPKQVQCNLVRYRSMREMLLLLSEIILRKKIYIGYDYTFGP